MLDWLFASPAERRLLGAGRLRGADAVGDRDHELHDHDRRRGRPGAGQHRRARRPVGSSGATRCRCPTAAATSPRVLQAVRSAPGVEGVEAVPESEMRKTLEALARPGGGEPRPAGAGAGQFRPSLGRGPRRHRAQGQGRGARARRSPRTAKASVRCCARSACCSGCRSALVVLLAGGGSRGGGAGGARRARHPSLDDRRDARHRRHRLAGHPPVPAQDRDRCA